ncbi:DUF2199 domain-containing protein [Leptothoe kymatousa]|uniref:DUF2199 domain-containing protein n=1 Tax=Leptothoe kymatousa TAU-MAC 1615 TaxID=2364775 RepID=A0ABS5XYZ6_9CYAN|nr:DUF2199 domain-containing protein [Leptothoe kymatousa]MBT9310833.1 DUF2199 domain-containing protein [Leptothoe kymatousa TAU-MAC 1615]
MTYKCKCCGKIHDALPDLGFDRPTYAASVPDGEFTSRVQLDQDLCVLDEEHYFIRGILLIPVHGYEQDFGLGVWVSQKKENFERYVDNFDTADIGPFFGWLSNEFMYGDQSTLSLKTMAHFQGEGLRPLILLEESDHPLSIAQRKGISLDEAWTFVHQHLN